MFTFHWSELLVVVIGGLVLFIGLAFLVLRRRNEILIDFLTPEEPNLEEEFFRVRKIQPSETLPEEETESETDGESETDHAPEGAAAERANEGTVQWGAQIPNGHV